MEMFCLRKILYRNQESDEEEKKVICPWWRDIRMIR